MAEAEKTVLELDRERKHELREKLKQLSECDEIVSAETVNTIGNVVGDVEAADDNAPSSDELDEDLESEYQALNDLLDLPDDTYSLSEIRPELPACIKYGLRSGTTHINLSKFSLLSRGYQGGAVAVAAFAATTVYKSRCWNESVIDQIVEDGDTFYCESYKDIHTEDRRLLTILDLKRDLYVQNKMNVNVSIEDPSYVGRFRSNDPKELHLAKALELFFKRHRAGILSSAALHMAIWKEARYYSIFDGQARNEHCQPISSGGGAAKLFLVKDLIGVLYVILEKSAVGNEPFVIYGIEISGVEPYSKADDPDEPEKMVGKPTRRPSGYRVQERFRAVIQGSYHLTHSAIPEALRGRAHSVIAVAALVYSRLVNANKWTTSLIDLIFNQANIYMIDLIRVLEKSLDDEEFEIKMDDLMGDIVLGVYSAKVKIRINQIPGFGKKKGKLTIDDGLREFFEMQKTGILEVKKIFYAIWKEEDTYYLLDPFACDEEGFRVNLMDTERGAPGSSLYRVAACVTMNSSINQIVETILENTGNKEKDPFFVHGVRVLYIKTGTSPGGPLEKVIYREKDTSRRPLPPPPPSALQTGRSATSGAIPDSRVFRSSAMVIALIGKTRNVAVQVPDSFPTMELYMMTDDEPRTFVILPEVPRKPEEEITGELDEEVEEEEGETEGAGEGAEVVGEPAVQVEPVVKIVKGYKKVNDRRIILFGSKNLSDVEFEEKSRGRQGLLVALNAIAYRRLKDPMKWRNIDVDQIIDIGSRTYDEVVEWIRHGSVVEKKEKGEIKGEDDEEDEEEAEDEEAVEGEEEEKPLLPAPSHLNLTMLPTKLQFGENDVIFKNRANLMIGETNPLANLAEAIDYYLNKWPDLVLENKRLVYAIWRDDEGNYYLLNPYGSDEEGWRLRGYPASLAVVSNLNELTELLYGLLEFNDHKFSIHYVGLDSIQPGKYASDEPVVPPDDPLPQLFQTRFLPITDDDFVIMKETLGPYRVKGVTDDDEEEQEEDDEEDEEEDKSKQQTNLEERPLVDPLLETMEQDQPDSPQRINLSLLTADIKIKEDKIDPTKETALHDQAVLEKLKYDHPPPYVLPRKHTLNILLEAKRAKRSIHSLVSRFSIDSRLDVKKKAGLAGMYVSQRTLITAAHDRTDQEDVPIKLIKLSEKLYIHTRLVPKISLMPIRAIDNAFIRGMEAPTETPIKSKEEFYYKDAPQKPMDVRVMPELIALGLIIRTPIPRKRVVYCPERKKRECLVPKSFLGDATMKRLLCSTENVICEMLFPGFKRKPAVSVVTSATATSVSELAIVNRDDTKSPYPAIIGFRLTKDNIGVLNANVSLDDRSTLEATHFKSCFYCALLCILAKVQLENDDFSDDVLDRCIIGGKKIYRHTGKLRYKLRRWFYNVEVLNNVFHIIAKQDRYADPVNHSDDQLSVIMNTFLQNNRTGILVFDNCSLAFWLDEDKYYLFDPYGCDESGRASSTGHGCLMVICTLPELIARIRENVGDSVDKPFRFYTLFITHMEPKGSGRRITVKKRRRRRRRLRKRKTRTEKHLKDNEDQPEADEETEQEEDSDQEEFKEDKKAEEKTSLIELSRWVTNEDAFDARHDQTLNGFSAIPRYNACMLDVTVVENDITRPIRTAMYKGRRRRVYDRKFEAHTALAEPLDLCIIAWSLIRDPANWSIRTIRALYEASKDYAFDSLLACEDSTVVLDADGLLPEFQIANYAFRVVLAPLHYAVLYATKGWNLAMSLKTVLERPIYQGGIIDCGDSHVAFAKRDRNYFAWWTPRNERILRIITTEDMEEFLRLIVKEMAQPNEVEFSMRAVTISYGIKLDPDCADVQGFYEPRSILGRASFPHIRKPQFGNARYNLDEMFRATTMANNIGANFVHGTVALTNRNSVKEPRVKRCYFIAVLAILVKRDIVQSPVTGMIDRILQVGERIYNEFDQAKFHSEQILRNVTVMNRLFDLRDVASKLISLTIDQHTGKTNLYRLLKKHMKRFFQRNTCGLLHLTTCCYGFWYCSTTRSYYYLDPYSCDKKGRATASGTSCLCIFPSVSQLVKHVSHNHRELSCTGFYIHRIHVDSINVPALECFIEDPMWMYLDYYWSFDGDDDVVNNDEDDERDYRRQGWNNYAVRVSNLIYSLRGSIGCYDGRFGERAGKNKYAVCVSCLAMQYLSHPSRWSAAILDSAVICGDTYYTESLRSSARRHHSHNNPFNLQASFDIFPNSWSIDFMPAVCGVLYGAREKLSLAAGLTVALEKSANLLVECTDVALAVLSAEDAFYVTDPCWIGPPLFAKDRGAIYALRCKNMQSLVYSITKIFNTNQRLEFRVTPVNILFEREVDVAVSKKPPPSRRQRHSKRKAEPTKTTRKNNNKILDTPVAEKPGKVYYGTLAATDGPTMPDAESLLVYRKNLSIGLRQASTLEDPGLPSLAPKLSPDNLRSMMVSTVWHLNLGQAHPLQRSKPPFDPRAIEHIPDECIDTRVPTFQARHMQSLSITRIQTACHRLPEIRNFIDNTPVDTLATPLDCSEEQNFVMDDHRKEFRSFNREMSHKAYNAYQHHLPRSVDRSGDQYRQTTMEQITRSFYPHAVTPTPTPSPSPSPSSSSSSILNESLPQTDSELPPMDA
ncbi:uncharacterized protein [Prorops nasuta]|uniref:uncharacterized protein n=1 Tax=Prorops nasuta TaxID=863751 RepID=UPI0034CEFD5F